MSEKKKKKKKWVTVAMVLVSLYVATWIGGWRSLSGELDRRAWAGWHEGTQREQEITHRFAAEGLDKPGGFELLKGGPVTHFWCVPLLPGVLLTKSSSIIGPMWGGGETKIVMYFGTGSFDLMILEVWIT